MAGYRGSFRHGHENLVSLCHLTGFFPCWLHFTQAPSVCWPVAASWALFFPLTTSSAKRSSFPQKFLVWPWFCRLESCTVPESITSQRHGLACVMCPSLELRCGVSPLGATYIWWGWVVPKAYQEELGQILDGQKQMFIKRSYIIILMIQANVSYNLL